MEKAVTDAELSVLEVLWQRGRQRIREIQEALYPEGGTSTYATVQKLLERLESKGCVVRIKSPESSPRGPHRFEACVERDELISSQLQRMADRLCQGSFAPLLTNLVKSKPLNQQERDELRRWLDDEEPPRKGGS